MADDDRMASSTQIRRASLLAGGLVLAGTGAMFLLVGLDTADKIASSAGFFVGRPDSRFQRMA
ncbi:hypothetical protein GCM10010411_32540 [Actinomadura fulvescens]|uniref:Uncharacterized protein n=1 Tax=Actinomadura fulvescens TaxID=46160 RepID=A0ABN3PR69_9ACTN